MTDYVLFIHGLSTRNEGFLPNYADNLIKLINGRLDENRQIKPVVLYWGNVGEKADERLLKKIEKSPDWEKLWFLDFRSKPLLRFVGDGALYISRYKGSAIVEQLATQALPKLQAFDPNTDRLHLITHSWGTIILFDVLFAARWDEDDIPGHDSVSKIRDRFFGVEPNLNDGMPLASLHTMGSPIALFDLMDVEQRIDINEEINNNGAQEVSTHDITPRLEQLLSSLYRSLERKLPWRNFIHPGDPIAYPLVPLIPELVDGSSEYIEIQDIVTHITPSDWLTNIVSQTTFALLHGGEAHGSYWDSEEVAQEIAEVIKNSWGLRA